MRPLPILGVLIACWISAPAARADAVDSLMRRVNASIKPCAGAFVGQRCVPDYTPYLPTGDCKTYAGTYRAELLKAHYAPEDIEVWSVSRGPGWAPDHAVVVLQHRRVLSPQFAWTENVEDLARRGWRLVRVVPQAPDREAPR